ncbi:glycerate kinase [Leifsonia aquatica]|uniref:glycerate kinase n=1 Tax=Leifsonia aquatica TaxID=144185 RepID=UPI0005B9EA19|nr:glycerate kinase [Leifsonia aquatica]
MSPRTVVIAPDSFKGSASAAEVATALAAGWAEVRPDDEFVLAPTADGGEGTLDAFAAAVPGAVRRPVRVLGPSGDLVDATWLQLPDGTAVVELAETSGLGLLRAPAPFDAHTIGFGQAIAAALDAGASALLLAIGGSASTDGGAGVLSALGARLLDGSGVAVVPGNRGLASLARVDLSGLRPLPSGGVRILSDVTNPLLGPQGAAAVFGPQKGAAPEDVPLLDAGLAWFAEALRAASGRVAGAERVEGAGRIAVSVDDPGTGAAGGTGFGLRVWGAAMTPGAPAVAEALGLPARIASADLVITGEGRYDSQSASGKAPEHVAELARRAGVPVLLAAGAITAEPSDFADAVALADLAGGSAAAIADPLRWARAAGADLASRAG